MAYIGKIKLTDTWTSVEDMISAQIGSFTFGSATYQLQSEGPVGARLANADSAPDDSDDGERIANTQVAFYTPDSSTLYARTEEGVQNVWLKISELS